MNAKILIPFLVLSLSGCSWLVPRYSHFQSQYGKHGLGIQHAHHGMVSDSIQEMLAKDSVAELAAIYPPARTSLTVHQDVRESFGKTLLSELRLRGFAVREVSYKDKIEETDALPISYIIDWIGSGWRVQLISGNIKYSREYQENISKGKTVSVSPAGIWSKAVYQ